MYKLLIIVNAEVNEKGKILPASGVTQKMITALKQAVNELVVMTEVVAVAKLWSEPPKVYTSGLKVIYCPLTIIIPDCLDFPAKNIYKACNDIKGMRHWVEKNLGYKTSLGDSWLGDLWLPVVVTGKGPLYGEVIAEGVTPNSYEQPVDLTDEQRQQLYYLAYRLLEKLSATPAVYLLQFSWRNQKIIFDRLWPFPAAPALASLKVQQPDLFTCHWYCLTNQPITDLTIMGMKSFT